MNKQTLRRMVGGGLFAAIIVVLQLIGGGIRFGTFSISLVLVPIVVGTAVYGWQMGGWLGLVFGAAVLLSGDANLFMTINPAGTIATVLIKGIACGLAAGGCYTALHEKHPTLATVAAAVAAPVVNTGVFLLGCKLFFMDFVREMAAGAGYESAGVFMIVGFVGINFLLELGVNIVLLAIDIGNTNVVLALLDAEDRVLEERRAPSKDGWTAEQYAAQIRALLCGRAVRGAAVSSVVPELTGVLSAAAREAAGVTALVVNSDSPVGLTLAIEQPETLGTEILAADAAAAEEYPLPVIVFDFGTATTVTVVDEQRRYRGGVILPGIKLGMQALFTGTAQLPDIRIEAPAHVICTETVESLQAGAVYGAAAMTDGLVERMESELGRPCTAVVTGGLGRFVVPHCRRRLVYDEHLLLRGLGMIWRRAQGEIHSCGAMGNAV